MTKILEPFGSHLKWDVAGASQAEGALAMPLVAEEIEREASSASPVVARAVEEVSERGQTNAGVLPLIARLCETLRAERVSFCHWKSNWKLERWLEGEGDLDLLVERADAQRFLAVISRLGFKQAQPTPDRDVPSVLNYYGFDELAGKFIHLHVHFQLVLGHDLTKNFRLALERPYLESADAEGLLPTPAPEFELITFVLRMVLKYSATETLLRRAFSKRGASSSSLRRELEYLEARADRAELLALLSEHLPFIDAAFFDACADSLRAGATASTRLRVRRGLRRRLSAQGRRANASDALLMSGRRIARFVREGIFRKSSRKRLAQGGAVVALVGGDGAGKTTCVEELHGWLSKKFVARKFHMGRPPRSPLTLGIIVLLRLRRAIVGRRETDVCVQHETDAQGHPSPQSKPFPGYIQLLRWVCAARDRHRLYKKLRHFANAGGIAVCDRYLVPQISLMDGPNIARSVEASRMNRLARLMLRAETNYYSRMMPADLLIVLRVEPEIAVRRKTDEDESHVRTRSQELWEIDWSDTRAHVVDAGQPVDEVVARLRSLVWSEL